MACKEPPEPDISPYDDLYNDLLQIEKPLIVARFLCLEGFFGASTYSCSPLTCIIKEITPSLSPDEQKKLLANQILKTIQSKESDPVQLKETLTFLSTILLRFDSATAGKWLQEHKIQVPCFKQPTNLPDAFPSTYRTFFNAVQRVCESNEIGIEAIISFLRESYPDLHGAVRFCTSYDDVFNLLYAYSSFMNTVYLKELLKRFDLYQQAVSEVDSHDIAVKEFCNRVTVQEAADEKYSFMPDCNRRFLILDTVEFRLDLECQCKTLSDVLKLIEETFPQMFRYVQLRCVYIEEHAVSIKCFAPYHLYLALLKQRDMADFLKEHRCILSISIGGVVVAEQDSEKEELKIKIQNLHQELDKKERTMKDRSYNNNYVQQLSNDFKENKRQLEEKNEKLEMTQKMLKGTQKELDDEKQKISQMHEALRQQDLETQPSLFQENFSKSTPQVNVQSSSETESFLAIVPDVSVVGSQKKRNIVVASHDHSTMPSATDDSVNTENTDSTSSKMKRPITVHTDTTHDKTDKSISMPYSYPADEAHDQNDLYFNRLDEEIKEETEPTQ